MSKLSEMQTGQSRQAARTRKAIQETFAELVFTRRYADIRMTDVARLANVGRSTLYLHYPDKDAILLESMSPLLEDLAEAMNGAEACAQVEHVLSHIWSHRDRGRVVLFGSTGQKLEAALAVQVAKRLPGRPAAIFVSNMIAAAVFSVLRTWLKGEASGSVPGLAQQICLSCEAIRAASTPAVI